jgi:hypothetical protein
MNTFFIILLILAVLIILPFILALFVRKNYTIRREISINASLSTVFGYIRQLKNQDHFNKWVMVDPDMKRTFTGTDGAAGFIYAWDGNKRAGAGEQEIKRIEEGKNVETEIRFIRPFAGIAHANLSTQAISDQQTKVIWSNESTMKYPLNLMIPMIEKGLAKDMDTSLNNLKGILEK